MKIEKREPFSMGGTSLAIILSTLIIGGLTIFMLLTAYNSYKLNEKYIVDNQAYYAADSEATTKRALIEEELYKVYYSKFDVKYDIKHIKRVIQDIKGVTLIETAQKTILIYYEEPINSIATLKIELEAVPYKENMNINEFTQVNKWQVVSQK